MAKSMWPIDMVSIPYGAIGWINGTGLAATSGGVGGVSIPYGAIGWINIVQAAFNSPFWFSFNPLRGNWVDQRVGRAVSFR